MQRRIAIPLCARSYSAAATPPSKPPPTRPRFNGRLGDSNEDPEDVNKEFGKMASLTDRMLKVSTKPPLKWKHTKTLRGDEKRLAASLRPARGASKDLPEDMASKILEVAKDAIHPPAKDFAAKNVTGRTAKGKDRPSFKILNRTSRPMSLEKIAYHAGEDVFAADADPSSANVFTPGTFVEARRNHISTHGIVLGEEFLDRRWRILLLTSSGDVWTPLRDDVMFAVPSFISDDMITRCGRRVVADEKELNARVTVLKRLNDLERSVELAFNRIQWSAHQLYDKIKSPEPGTWTSVRLDEAAATICPNSDLVHMFAVHKFLMQNSLQYVAQTQYRSTRTFDVRPQRDIDNIGRVTTLIRESHSPSSPLNGFFRKAQGIIERHQRIRQQTRTEPPTPVVTKVTWSPEEQDVLTFLLRSLRATRSTQVDPYHACVNLLLKRIHPKLSVIHQSVVHQTLADLGVIPPWQDSATLRDRLEITPEQRTLREARQKDIVDKAFSSSSRTTASTPTPLGPEDFYLQDPLESLRHDFGDLPVYVLDDATAQELDDGISVEAIPTEPGCYWVHIHIADPASVIPPTHAFVHEARAMGETKYYINHSQPMLPHALMEHGLSLGSSLRKGEPQRVLTFSGKIDTDGDIIDYKVRAGIVNNVKVLTYDSVDAALGIPPRNIKYPFLQSPPKFTTPSLSISPSEIEPLKISHQVAQRLIARRIVANSFNVTTTRSNIRLCSPLCPSEITTDRPTVYRGFPELEYSVYEISDQDTGSRGMVAEMMKVACQVASRFGRDRGLPLLRRTAGPALASNPDSIEALLKMRSPTGFVPLCETLRRGVQLSAAVYSIEPLGHWGLGIPDGEGYSRVTSPLRRFADLVSHWQIHSALLSSTPFFTPDWLKEYANVLASEDRARKRRDDAHLDFWKFLYIRNQMEGGSPEVRQMLDNLQAEIVSPPTPNTMTMLWQCQANVTNLGVQGSIGNLERVQIQPDDIGRAVHLAVEEIKLGTRPQLELKLIQ